MKMRIGLIALLVLALSTLVACGSDSLWLAGGLAAAESYSYSILNLKEATDAEGVPDTLIAAIEIEGYWWGLTFPIGTDVSDITQYIEAHYDDILQQAIVRNEYIGPTTWENIPMSMHVAALKSVALVDGSPRAVVYRLYLDKVYEIPGCRVAQVAYDNYLAGKIKVYNSSYSWQAPENKDCFVLVYFISETPYGDEVQIPVIVDKIIK